MASTISSVGSDRDSDRIIEPIASDHLENNYIKKPAMYNENGDKIATAAYSKACLAALQITSKEWGFFQVLNILY